MQFNFNIHERPRVTIVDSRIDSFVTIILIQKARIFSSFFRIFVKKRISYLLTEDLDGGWYRKFGTFRANTVMVASQTFAMICGFALARDGILLSTETRAACRLQLHFNP
jgi:hypothetical protein